LHYEVFAHERGGIKVAVYVYNGGADSLRVEGTAGDLVEIQGFAEVKKLQIYVVVEVTERVEVAKAHLQLNTMAQRPRGFFYAGIVISRHSVSGILFWI
jgi:hypothetical protein